MCCWAINREQLQVAFLLVSLHQREFDRRIVELLDVITTSLGCDDLLNLDDLEEERKVSQLAPAM